MRRKICNSLCCSVPLLLIMVLVLFYSRVNYYPKLYGDEYGYLAAGAYFAGLDWDDVTAMNEYYGWGYGLILSFILRLPVSSKVCYISAVALNGIMLWGIYLIYYKLTEELFKEKSMLFSSVVSFACTILPSSLYYTQFTTSEVILEFVYCLLLYELWSLIKRYEVKRMVIVALLNSWLLSIHLRTIGIVAISVIAVFCICYFLPNKKIKFYLVFLLVLIVGVIGVNWIKSIYQEGIALDFIKLRTGNTASGQMGKFQMLFTLEGIQSFMANLLGRFFSLFVNSYMMAFVAMYCGILEFVKGVKNKHTDSVSVFTILCLFNTLSLMSISALYMIGTTSSRFDILTYSRYHEFATGILILLGMYYSIHLVRDIRSNRTIIAFILSLLIISKVVGLIMSTDSTPYNLYAHNPRVLFFYRSVSNKNETYFLMFILALLIFAVMFVLIKYKFNRLYIGLLCIIIVMNIYESNFIFREGVLSWSENYFLETDEMKDFIVSNDYQNTLCFLADDDILKVDLLRYAMKNDRIVVVDEERLDGFMDEGYILITTPFYCGEADLQSYEIIYGDNNLYLWGSTVNE